MSGGKGYFGGQTKATDGVIATFDLDGERFSKHFFQVLHTKGEKHRVFTKDPPESPTQQAINYADTHGAKIACVSSPETILRDLRGDRTLKKKNRSVNFPESNMLRGRLDMFLRPFTSQQEDDE